LHVYCDESKDFEYKPYVDPMEEAAKNARVAKREEVRISKTNTNRYKASRSKALSKAIREYEKENPSIKAEMMKKKAEEAKEIKKLSVALRNGTLHNVWKEMMKKKKEKAKE